MLRFRHLVVQVDGRHVQSDPTKCGQHLAESVHKTEGVSFMVDFSANSKNVVKLRSTTDAESRALVPAKGEFNISALARSMVGAERLSGAGWTAVGH
jgi:hypothetical protein